MMRDFLLLGVKMSGNDGGAWRLHWASGWLPAWGPRAREGKRPARIGGAVSISVAQLSYLLKGIEWRNPSRTWRPLRAG